MSAQVSVARVAYTDRALIGRLFRELRPWSLHIGAIFGMSLLATPLALLMPVPLKIVVDSVLGPHPLPGGFYVCQEQTPRVRARARRRAGAGSGPVASRMR
jgi:hypothetical protein